MVKLKKKRVWLMCGIPGSGKSHWIRNHVDFIDDEVVVISRDAIRFSLLSDDDEYFSREHIVWKLFVKQANEAILNDNVKDIILDATHLNEKSRFKVMKEINNSMSKKDCGFYAITLITPLSLAQERNTQRTGRSLVPATVIENMALSFTVPTKEEGFDEVFFVIPDEYKDTLILEGVDVFE